MSVTDHANKKTNEAFFRQLEKALVLMDDFNHLNICRKDNAAAHKQSRSYSKCIKEFLDVEVHERVRGHAQFKLTPTNKEEHVKVEGSLGCSEPETVDFKILRHVSKTNSRVTVLGFRKADFDLFGYLLDKILCETALEGKEDQES